ncbi:hypothetical protein [Streptomyces sp. NPDC093707]|uniref:hypothetical protein n=1 Tax=Streptomyces sp. NPDC093707 TaxID=3154984 RepID=UPI003450C137
MPTHHLISVIGNSPGVGKSTLCRSLAAWLGESGATVEHFAEADILTHPAFRPVAEEFAAGAHGVRPETLVAATAPTSPKPAPPAPTSWSPTPSSPSSPPSSPGATTNPPSPASSRTWSPPSTPPR